MPFLRGVAPTKLVDGAWLYGLLPCWDDACFTALIQAYLEELGEGLLEKNHVLLYRKPLANQGCNDWQTSTSSRPPSNWPWPGMPEGVFNFV